MSAIVTCDKPMICASPNYVDSKPLIASMQRSITEGC